jgi:hypothetical protein
MNSKDMLYRFLRLALIDIRHEAKEIESTKIAALSDLFHNLPSALGQNEVNYDKLLNELKERADSQKGLGEWLKNNTPSS